MLNLTCLPNCCTMKVISGFGGTLVAGKAIRYRELSVEEIVTDIEICLEMARGRGQAIVIATTNNEQINAIEALRRSGFAHLLWASKIRQPDNRVRLWYKELIID